MVDEKLFDDAIRLASLWLTKTKATDSEKFRNEVEATVQSVYGGLLSVRERINSA
jgi:hypothetical protein